MNGTVEEKFAVLFVTEQRDPLFTAGFSTAEYSSFQSSAAPARLLMSCVLGVWGISVVEAVLCGCGKDRAAILSATACLPGVKCGAYPGRGISRETDCDIGFGDLKRADESVVD